MKEKAALPAKEENLKVFVKWPSPEVQNPQQFFVEQYTKRLKELGDSDSLEILRGSFNDTLDIFRLFCDTLDSDPSMARLQHLSLNSDVAISHSRGQLSDTSTPQ